MAHATSAGGVSRNSRLLQIGSNDVSAIATSANTTHIIGASPYLLQHSAKPQVALKRASAEHDKLRVY